MADMVTNVWAPIGALAGLALGRLGDQQRVGVVLSPGGQDANDGEQARPELREAVVGVAPLDQPDERTAQALCRR